MSGTHPEPEYGDIINLNRPADPAHPKMSVRERAAQFMPFQALTGYGQAVQEMEEQHLRELERG